MVDDNPWSAPTGPQRPQTPAPQPRPTSGPTGGERAIGFVLLLPVLGLGLLSWVAPFVVQLLMSLTDTTVFGGFGDFVGVSNYVTVAGSWLRGIGPGLAMTMPVFAVAAVLGTTVGLAALGSRPVQLVGRVVTGILLAAFAPVAVALGYLVRGNGFGLGGSVLIALVAYGPVAIALTALAVAAVVTRDADAPRRSPTRAIALVLAIVFLVCLAAGSGAFTVPYVSASRSSYAFQVWQFFLTGRTGGAAALGMLSMIIPVLLGVAVTAIVVHGRFRLRVPRSTRTLAPTPAPATGTAIGLVGVIVGAIAVVITIVAWLPALPRLDATPGTTPVLAGTAVRTWGTSLLVALGRLIIAVVTGLAIGWFRPLGRHSLVLLYLFAPTLLVNHSALVAADYFGLRTFAALDSVPALVAPAAWPSAAMIMIVAVGCLGWREQRERTLGQRGTTSSDTLAPGPGSPSSGPLLAGLVGLGLVALVVNAASLYWSLLSVNHVDRYTGPLMALTYYANPGGGGLGGPLAPAFVLPVQLVVLAASVLVCLGTRRLSLRTGPTG